MAATCEERGIKHVKDIFSSPNSMTFLARKPAASNNNTLTSTKPLAPPPPRHTSANATAASQNKGNTGDKGSPPKTIVQTKTADAGKSPDRNVPEKNKNNKVQLNCTASEAETAQGLTRGEYFLRANKDKHINTMELPVPTPQKAKPNGNIKTLNTTEKKEDIYLSPSPTSYPTSPGYNKSLPTPPTSPGYSAELPIQDLRRFPKLTEYNTILNSSYPVPKFDTNTKAVVELQPMQSPGYEPTVLNGFLSQPTTPQSAQTDHVYAHHVEIYRPADFNPPAPTKPRAASPVYDRKLDFLNHQAPSSPTQETGSLFSGDLDSPSSPPYSTIGGPPIASVIKDDVTSRKPSKSGGGLFAKKSDKSSDCSHPFGFKKQLSNGDDTNSSIAPSSGYHSGLDSEVSVTKTSPPMKKSTKVTSSGVDDSLEEEECVMDFADDDAMYNSSSPKYPVYREYDGEDFSKYLQDDHEIPQYSATSLARKVQQKRRQQQNAGARPAPPQKYNSNPRSNQSKPAGTLKQRISQALTLTRGEKNKHVYQAQPLTSIHQFSFMDSKMGNYADVQEINDYMARDLETRSDIGGVRRRDSATPPRWHNDTLSMSTLRRAKLLLDKQHKFSSSVPDLNSHYPQSGVLAGSTPNLTHKGESYSDFGADIKRKKKVNRFKFWKIFQGKKKSKKENGAVDNSSSLGFDEPKFQTQNKKDIMDVHL